MIINTKNYLAATTKEFYRWTAEQKALNDACTHPNKQPALSPAKFYCPDCGHLELIKP